MELGVNIDHVATLREARRTFEPDPVWAAVQAELGGADGITVHLREDRRHINDRDVRLLRETVTAKLNLEMACADDILDIACKVRPDQATIVPERREEITTEGGLDLVTHKAKVGKFVRRMQDHGIFVSLFLDPDRKQIEAALEIGANAIELHTGSYAQAETHRGREHEMIALSDAGSIIVRNGLRLHAGHGLTYHNVRPVTKIPHMEELNIGHSIVARSLMVGLKEAVAEMKKLIQM